MACTGIKYIKTFFSYQSLEKEENLVRIESVCKSRPCDEDHLLQEPTYRNFVFDPCFERQRSHDVDTLLDVQSSSLCYCVRRRREGRNTDKINLVY